MNYYELGYHLLGILLIFMGVFMGMIVMYIRLDYLGAIDVTKIKEAKDKTWRENYKAWYDREAYKAWVKMLENNC